MYDFDRYCGNIIYKFPFPPRPYVDFSRFPGSVIPAVAGGGVPGNRLGGGMFAR